MLITQETKLPLFHFLVQQHEFQSRLLALQAASGLPWIQGSGWRLWLKSHSQLKRNYRNAKGIFVLILSPFLPNLSLIRANQKLKPAEFWDPVLLEFHALLGWPAHMKQFGFGSGLFWCLFCCLYLSSAFCYYCSSFSVSQGTASSMSINILPLIDDNESTRKSP